MKHFGDLLAEIIRVVQTKLTVRINLGALNSHIDIQKNKRYTANMFGISGEHLLILGIVLLLFGPRRLPELGNTLGKAIRNFKDAIDGIEEAKFRKIETEEIEKKQKDSQILADKESTKSDLNT